MVDRLLRLRGALAGMAQELGALKREHRRLARENAELREQIRALRHTAADRAYAG